MDFVKMHGLGNDFIVVEGTLAPAASDVSSWCDRRRGIGADGVLAVSAEGGDRVRMQYWNADGSPSEMCGNGLRCVARFAVERRMVPGPELTVMTPVGERAAVVRSDGSVRAFLGPVGLGDGGPLELAGYRLETISVGNPHAVAVVDDCYSVPVGAVGPVVEGDPHFPDRTNVEFVTVVSRDRVELRVWERGVGETLACGSGAAAAVAVAKAKGLVDGVVTVNLPGGPLKVEILDGGAWIDGPAEFVFSGTM